MIFSSFFYKLYRIIRGLCVAACYWLFFVCLAALSHGSENISELNITSSTQIDSVIEQHFELEVFGHKVPGILWTPAEPQNDMPIVLWGHGYSQNKSTADAHAFALHSAKTAGIATVIIDAFGHGDRPRQEFGLTPEAFKQSLFSDDAYGIMIADWKAVLDTLDSMGGFDMNKVGYIGFSMGTIYGIPVVAAEPRIKTAVFGLWNGEYERTRIDAANIDIPLLFIWNWDDQLVTYMSGIKQDDQLAQHRQSSMDLFDTFASKEKHMHVHSGNHGTLPPYAKLSIGTFILERMNGRNENNGN